jgi:two-component system, NtrC family, C4-dicarboxylate transport sensor histidine kinase DctB
MSGLNFISIIMLLSIAIQFVAAVTALRLIRVSGVVAAWSMVASALLVMGVRRAIALLHIWDGTSQGDLTVELLGLLISILMAVGIYRIKPLFDQLIRSRQELLSNQRQLEEVNRTLAERVECEVRLNLEKDRMMMHQGREAVMGEMVGNIAHQWRQPLNNIALCVQELQCYCRAGTLAVPVMDTGVDRVMGLIRFMSQTIEDFTNFFSPQKLCREFLLKNEIERALSFVSHTYLRNGIELVSRIETSYQLYGPPNELTQVLMNLLQNASDAFYGKNISGARVEVHALSENDKGVVIIRDNAGGILPDMLDHLFEAYATSKVNGSGIGLYMSRVIIENTFKGSITARNVEGGAEFRIEV